jgi:dienelactone hydrolase
MPILPRRFVTLLKLALVALGIFMLICAGLILYLALDRNAPLALPAPTGSYAVGRAELDWVDPARPDPLAGQGSAPRELVVWVWYPAAGAGASPAPYLPPAWVQARADDQGALGMLIEKDLNTLRTHSFEGAALAAQPALFPLLVMQPGMGPMASDYTVFAENLASHGYVVVGINQTYTSNWTVFPDGRYVPRSTLGTIPDSATPAEAETDAIRIGAVWAQDATFTLDQLAKMNADPGFFHQRLDLGHIGLWGHSIGGATALAVCQHDPRCKAGVDLDGSPWGDEKQAALLAPFMIMTEDYSRACDEACALLRQVLLHSAPGTGYLVSLAGAGHFNYSDLPLRQEPIVRPLFALAGFEGAIPPARALEITNAYLVAFFDQYLKGTPQALLGGPPPTYPEVASFEKH